MGLLSMAAPQTPAEPRAFDRARTRRWLRELCPIQRVATLADVDPNRLWAQGKRLLLLDMDHTLVPWRANDVPDSSRRWLESARAAGFKLAVLSNTRHPDRLIRLCDELGLEWVQGPFKPNPAVYLLAVRRAGVTTGQTIMVGDQLFTDIRGANRAGIDAIAVTPLSPRDFIGTRALRILERWAYTQFAPLIDPESR